MRLIDLRPKWVGRNGKDWSLPGYVHVGITFDCPHCHSQRIGVFFKPYINNEGLAEKIPWALPDHPDLNTGEPSTAKFWNRTGDAFETLTLSPSIDVSSHEHWHGFIQDGEIK